MVLNVKLISHAVDVIELIGVFCHVIAGLVSVLVVAVVVVLLFVFVVVAVVIVLIIGVVMVVVDKMSCSIALRSFVSPCSNLLDHTSVCIFHWYE